ncbi:MAG TPA: sugar transferase [Anaerolineales bacterium]|nr:sugar transferase [Anaerolineales bacterium]
MAKRTFDLLLSSFFLVLLSPIFLIISVTLLLSIGWPVFFTQPRPGFKGKIFNLIKFRTMLEKVGPSGELLPDEERLTSIGKFLRAFSLDELPELWNILIGQMSFVGPRPLLVKYLPLYSEVQKRRHDVLPGLTGWAQINGRNALTWHQKFEFDLWYVDHANFWLDLKIILITISKVLKREGISQAGFISSEEFNGNN